MADAQKRQPRNVRVNPPVELEPRDGDIELSTTQLRALSLFKLIDAPKNIPNFDQHPRAVMLRRYGADRRGGSDKEICRQGEAGFTAFYVLTAEDLNELAKSYPHIGQTWLAPPASAVRTEVAAVHLAVARSPAAQSDKSRPSNFWDVFRSRKPVLQRTEPPLYIPFDGPADIPYDTLKASIYPGEVFGEIACLEGIPRSATVVAQRCWYVLEMTQNIFERFQEDAGYRAYWQALSKKRAVGIHLRKFSIFRDLTNAEFRQLLRLGLGDLDDKEADHEVGRKVDADAVDRSDELFQWVEHEHGEVIFDEHDTPDSMYVIHSGLVQIVQGESPLLGKDDVVSWPRLCTAIADGEQRPEHLKGFVWKRLADLQLAATVKQAAKGTDLSEELKQELLDALNGIIKDAKLSSDSTGYSDVSHPSAKLAAELSAHKEAPRRVHRRLLEALYSGTVRTRTWNDETRRILAYRGRGETIGEMGVLLKRPRIATCITHSHSEGKSRIKLLRINAKALEPLLRPGTALHNRLLALTQQRREETETPSPNDPVAATRTKSFNDLNLIQGQKLLLIDLDRCTRCDECVQACVATHDDGQSRLFLDGPRYQHDDGARTRPLLVPTTCRACLNPECMMGCPVGSIHRGDRGEIVIENWCIGCKACAELCPFGAIFMRDVGVVPLSSHGWQYLPDQLIFGDDSWRRPGFRARDWQSGATPFHCDAEFQASLANRWRPGDEVSFRYEFQHIAGDPTGKYHYRLNVVTTDEHVVVWLNGRRVDGFGHESSGAKRTQSNSAWTIETDVARDALAAGANTVAARLRPSAAAGEMFNLALYEVREPLLPFAITPTDVSIIPKVVEKRAVVCDLCADHPGGPACVKACPHEAALRFDARAGVPRW